MISQRRASSHSYDTLPHHHSQGHLQKGEHGHAMAAGYETLTVAATSNDILRLTSPHLSSAESNKERFSGWGTSRTGISGDLDLSKEFGGANLEMEMGMEMKMGGGVMDAFDHDLNFEGESLLDGMPSLPFTPSYDLDAFSTTFEDPFSYQSETFSLVNTSTAEPHSSTADPSSNTSESTTENPDNKLLSFGPPIPKCALLSSTGTQTWPSMTAELYGMFFVAEDVFGDTATPAGRPMELTCYRRNLFQISGNITMSRGIKSLVNDQGQQVPLYDLSATISAVESIEGKPTEIISVPWKTASQSIPGSSSAEDKSGALPPKWPLDLTMNPELDPSVVSIPIAWKRLQFKHATANNGRRKGLQQHYVIQINLMGMLGNGESVKLAEIQSGPIIVRGRSPRNFDSRKDVSLSGGERRVEVKARTASDASNRELPVKADPAVANGSYKFYALNALQQPLDLPEWNTASTTALPSPSLSVATDSHRAKKPALPHSSSSNSTRPPVPKTKWKSDSTPTKSTHHTAPIDLSIADEEYGRAGSSMSGSRSLSVGERSPQLDRIGSGSGKKTLVGSPVENADLLYEYFPLSLDDWMPPVDAIYRPHVVHHTIVPPDLKAEQVKNKTKRYFSADD